MDDAILFIDNEELGFKFEATDEDYKMSSVPSTPPPTKRKRKSTKSATESDPGIITGTVENNRVTSLPISFKEEYNDTNNMLLQSIAQIDSYTQNIENDLSIVRNKNNLAKKYDYISALVGSSATLVGTKISAIREINNSIKSANDMELKRMKDLKLGEENMNDDKLIQSLYRDMIQSQPTGAPTQYNTLMATIPGNIANTQVITGVSDEFSLEQGFNNYMNNMSPEQNLMMLEGNPDIEEVVCYDRVTGSAFFDIINKRTGASVPNVPKKDQMFMEHTIIDLAEMSARNNKLGETYRVVFTDSSNYNTISEY